MLIDPQKWDSRFHLGWGWRNIAQATELGVIYMWLSDIWRSSSCGRIVEHGRRVLSCWDWGVVPTNQPTNRGELWTTQDGRLAGRQAGAVEGGGWWAMRGQSGSKAGHSGQFWSAYKHSGRLGSRPGSRQSPQHQSCHTPLLVSTHTPLRPCHVGGRRNLGWPYVCTYVCVSVWVSSVSDCCPAPAEQSVVLIKLQLIFVHNRSRSPRLKRHLTPPCSSWLAWLPCPHIPTHLLTAHLYGPSRARPQSEIRPFALPPS